MLEYILMQQVVQFQMVLNFQRTKHHGSVYVLFCNCSKTRGSSMTREYRFLQFPSDQLLNYSSNPGVLLIISVHYSVKISQILTSKMTICPDVSLTNDKINNHAHKIWYVKDNTSTKYEVFNCLSKDKFHHYINSILNTINTVLSHT